jgi:flagellar hook-associated protein 2
VSDISIPGISSKYNTQKVIEDLMKVERIPLERMEVEVTDFQSEKRLWQDFNRRVSTLQRSAKRLYSYENPFSDKIVLSSQEKALTAVATREADFSEYRIEILELARGDKFLSASIPQDYRVPAGDYVFNVGDKEVTLKYRGGTISDFISRLNQKGENLIKFTLIRNTSDTRILSIEALKTGDAGVITFGGAAEKLALDLGVIRPAIVQGGAVTLDSRSLAGLTPGTPAERMEIAGDTLTLKPGGNGSLKLNSPYAVKPGTTLVFDVQITPLSQDYYVKQTSPLPDIPGTPGINFQSINIDSAGSVLALPDAEKQVPPQRVDDLQVLFVSDGTKEIPLPLLQDGNGFVRVEIPLTGRLEILTDIRFRNNNTYREIAFKNIGLVEPGQRGQYEAANPVSTAGKARFLFEGVEILRENNSVDDLIPGVTLNLLAASDGPVDLKVEPDTEKAKESIIEFVFNYNQVITWINILTSGDPTVIDELEYLTEEERTDAQDKLGAFKGDVTLMQLKSRMQTISAGAYETFLGDKMALLTQIGISTNQTKGGSGGGVDQSKLRGYLEIDEEKLDAALKNNMPAVKELFGLDTDGDLVIDNGVGKKLDDYLLPYTQTGGFIATKVSRIDSQIDRKKKEITDYKEHLVDYEADLKRKYGQMEGALNQLEGTSNSLDNLNNSSGGRRSR